MLKKNKRESMNLSKYRQDLFGLRPAFILSSSIIVFDISLVDSSILRVCENVSYLHGVGFVAVVDSQKGDFRNLAIAYMLARDLVLNLRSLDVDPEVLVILISKILRDLSEVTDIKHLVLSNIENNKNILRQLEKSMLLMEFNQEYLKKFLKDGKLSKKDLLDFYMGDQIKDRYRLLEKDIESI